MKRRVFLAAAASAALSGCGGLGVSGRDSLAGLMQQQQALRMKLPDMDQMAAKSRLMQDLMNNPDLPAWHAQREKMALAVGDRVFDRGFDRVFDAMTVALATLGSRVNNMERVSGYITASIPDLGPTRMAAMQQASLRQYAAAKGYSPRLIEQRDEDFDLDVGGTSGMMTRGMAGMTLSLLRQGARQTKVKLRFDNVFYPELVSEYYKLVWAAVDKQMFLDQSLD